MELRFPGDRRPAKPPDHVRSNGTPCLSQHLVGSKPWILLHSSLPLNGAHQSLLDHWASGQSELAARRARRLPVRSQAYRFQLAGARGDGVAISAVAVQKAATKDSGTRVAMLGAYPPA